MSSIEISEILMNPELVRARGKVLAREHRTMRSALVSLRREAGLTQNALAERMGVTQQAISKFERYDTDPRLSTVRRYANAVGALIEHQVERDLGQSPALAASKSAWVQMDVVRFLDVRNQNKLDLAHLGTSDWSASAAKKTDFALAL